MEFIITDTELGLYDSNGNLIANNDDIVFGNEMEIVPPVNMRKSASFRGGSPRGNGIRNQSRLKNNKF